jgi:hypothetical protein
VGSYADTALLAAAVSGIVTALGWWASHWSTVRLEDKRRLEKIIDVQWALLAEIECNLARYAEVDLGLHEKDMLNRIRSGRGPAGFTPFVPREVAEIVFEAFLADIHILPTETIRDVVAYYKQEYKLRELVEDLRGERYAGLDSTRKAHLYSHYIWQIRSVLVYAERARASLVGQLGPEAQKPGINNRAADPSRASGS